MARPTSTGDDAAIIAEAKGRIMTRWIAALLALLAGTADARADAFSNTAPFTSGSTFTATNGTRSRSVADRAADVVNVKDFGAFCDNNTDDAAAFNAAFTFARNLTNDPQGHQAVKIVIPHGSCVIGSSLNLTGFSQSYEVFVDGAGSILYGQTNGQPVIDALGSRFIHFQNVSIFGKSTLTPSIGIQIGRISGNSADDFKFDNVSVNGQFTFAAFYNFASETVLFSGVYFNNNYAGSVAANTGYGVVQDGMNHFNITSQFATQTISPDTAESFNENTFVGATVQTNTGAPFWLGGTGRHKFIGSYSSTVNPNAVILWTGTGTGFNFMLDMDVHFETGAIVDTFLLTGTNTTPSLLGFSYRDHLNFASNSLFKLDTGLTVATMTNAHIDVQQFQAGAKVFDVPAKWTVSGDIFVPSTTNWSMPAAMSGRAVMGTSTILYQGNANSVSGSNAAALGQSNASSNTATIALGLANSATQIGSVVTGWNGTDRSQESFVFGGKTGQLRNIVLSAITTSATGVRAVVQGGGTANSANTVNVPANTVYATRLLISARRTDALGSAATWVVDGGMLFGGGGAGTVSWTGATTPAITQTLGTTTGWAVALAADTTNGGLSVTVTGAAAQTINWTAVVETAEVQ